MTKKNFKGIDLAEENYPSAAYAKNAFTIAAPIPEQNAKDAYEAVLKYCGAILPKRDGVDERVINETKTGTATGKGVFGKAGIIDSPLAVGGWSTYKTIAAPVDTDEDGMPDEWETEKWIKS